MPKVQQVDVLSSPHNCEKCNSEESYIVSLLGTYPATLCMNCRRRFEVDVRKTPDYLVWVSASHFINRSQESYRLLIDSQSALGEFVIDWMKRESTCNNFGQEGVSASTE